MPIVFPPVIAGSAAILDASITGMYIENLGLISDPETIVGVSFGATVTAPNKRYIVVAMIAPDMTSVTIGGVTATLMGSLTTAEVAGLAFTHDWYFAEVPSGTSGNIVVNPTGASPTLRISVFRCVNLDPDNPTASDTGAGATITTGFDLTIPAGGGVVAHGNCAYSSGSNPSSLTFANLTLLGNTPLSSNQADGYAGQVFASAQSGLNCDFDPAPNTNLTRSHVTGWVLPPLF